jgi:lipopolysaccharide/colanic/teichoic acid biosynthesis glycosyltransferase
VDLNGKLKEWENYYNFDRPNGAFEEVIKCTTDILLASLLCFCLWPLFLVITILVKMEDGGAIFYFGTRIGRHGKSFKMIKFRSMVMNAEQLGGFLTPNDDPRITKIGKFLRKYKLDELPQLINVLKGEMSFVGPRPEVENEVRKYSEKEKKILLIKPGITDWASIKFHNEGGILKGNTDETYRILVRPEKMHLALKYIEKKSFLVDMKILNATLYTLIKSSFKRNS